jgi:uncharacterized membrane protein YbhN (UPF0104 family)
MQSTLRRIKPYTRWFILALTMGFIVHTLRQNWQQVMTLRLTDGAIALIVIATGVTLFAHIWSAWVWYQIIQLLNLPTKRTQTIVVYLKTNLEKYLPGNFWHFFRRVQFLKTTGASTGVAVTGVLLEPLLMAAAALAIILVSLPATWLQVLILGGVLVAVHPRMLNPILKRLATSRFTQIESTDSLNIPRLNAYPWQPFVGEVLFVLLRGIGFGFAFASLQSLSVQDCWIVLGSFSFAWMMGLVVPGAPGGLGVFEATILALLGARFSPATVLGTAAVYRLISTLAEVLGVGLAVTDERLNGYVSRTSSTGATGTTTENLPLALPSFTSASLGEQK